MKVCFWGEIAAVLDGKFLGGGEKQIALLAKALVRSGHEVVYVDYTVNRDYITSDGIKVFSIKDYNKGIKIIRTFTHRLRLVYTSLRDQNADLYYCRIRDFRHILAFWAARKVRAKFILGAAADLDIMGFGARLKYLYFKDDIGLWWLTNALFSEIVYPYLLRKSDLVIVQHDGQKTILSKKGIKARILNNLIDLAEIPQVTVSNRHDFVYVGALDKRKGFDIFYELIQKSARHNFKIIGEPRDKTANRIFNKLKTFENVKLLGKLPYLETYSHIANSKALISTSPKEGFPNIFIEAWANGIPVLTLYVDPGEVVQKYNLGFSAQGDFDLLLKSMETIENSESFSLRSKKYVESNHVLNKDKINEIDDLFCAVVNGEKTTEQT